jgi:arylsulfatase A
MLSAIVPSNRRGNYKLIEFYDDMRVELYNEQDDVGERRNLAAFEPERVRAPLRDELLAWRASVDAPMPTPTRITTPPP